MALSECDLAAIMHGPRDFRLEEREVLVEVRAIVVCGSDHYHEEGGIGENAVRKLLILGHESSGVVVDLGKSVTRHAVGDWVTLEPGVPDMTRRKRRTGRHNLCPNVRLLATPPAEGTFTSYVTIHEDFAFSLRGTFRYANTCPTLVGLAANGRVDLEALRESQKDPSNVKPMFIPK